MCVLEMLVIRQLYCSYISMAANYASALSPYDNKGKCGLPEIFDDESSLSIKVDQLVQLITTSQCMIAHTGAGISTAAGIADFRGPNGIWTLERRNGSTTADTTNNCVDFGQALPTYTHYALNALETAGYLKFIITQNVDGLHVRSGFPLNRLAELHGNVFVEQCTSCQRKYYRSQPVATIGLRLTGNICGSTLKGRSCRGKLRDALLDWEDALPDNDLAMSDHFSRIADLSLCLGTTLQIVPAGNLPLRCKKNGGKMVTINLQMTKHEKRADIAIHARVDDVMRMIMDRLNLQVIPTSGIIDDPIPVSIHPMTMIDRKSQKTKRGTKRKATSNV